MPHLQNLHKPNPGFSNLSVLRNLLLSFPPISRRVALPPLLCPRPAAARAVPGQLGPLLAERVCRGAEHARLDVL